MTKKNSRRIKQGNVVSDDVVKVRTLIILLLVIILISVGIYFLTDVMIKKENANETKVEDVTISYDIATVGTMFNRVEEEYFVLLYSNEEDGSELNSVLDTYRSSDNYIKTYYIDLDNKFNNHVLGDKLVIEPKNSNEVMIKEATLYKIKKGIVIECISGVNKIIEKLEK